MASADAAGKTADRHAAPRSPGHLTIHTALYIGFGLVFVLWLASGLDVVHRLSALEQRARAVGAQAATADEQLTTVRVRVLSASVYVRDAVLDTSPGAAGYYRDQIRLAKTDTDHALEHYVPVAWRRGQAEGLGELRAELDAFWATLDPVLDHAANRETGRAWALLRGQVVPKREIVGRLLRRIQDLNRIALAQEQADVDAIYADVRRRVWWSSGLALVVSLAVALAVTHHAGRLERQVHEQLLKDAENTFDLQRLSARLVSAQEDERRTIARELHDEVGQALTAVKVELSVAARKAALTERGEEALLEARRLADMALQQVRDMSQLLHPAMLDDLGLPETLAWYVNSYSLRTGIRAAFTEDGMGERLAPEIETCLYRIVQEALTNTARHSKASQCSVRLQRLPGGVRLTVEDDGQGFSPADREAAGERRGLGLLGIEERVAGFRGSLSLDTAPGRGTRLTVELPAIPRPGAGAPATLDATTGTATRENI